MANRGPFFGDEFQGCRRVGRNDVVDTILLGPGEFRLERAGVGEDDNLSADLDIRSDLEIVGAGAALTSVRGGEGYLGRILHIHDGQVLLRDLTVRNGDLPSQGAGGGLRNEAGAEVVLERVVVGLNRADGNAGGILNRGVMALVDSAVTGNRVLAGENGGGGVFSSSGSRLTSLRTRILDNQVTARSDFEAGGGGIYAEAAEVVLVDTAVEGNTVESSDRNDAFGGGLACVRCRLLEAQRVTLAENLVLAAGTASGGGAAVFLADDGSQTQPVRFTQALVAGNRLDNRGVRLERGSFGAGLMFQRIGVEVPEEVVISGSQIIDNLTGTANDGTGGGIALSALGHVRIQDTTIARNQARGEAQVTFFGASRGGGVFASSVGRLSMQNVTLFENVSSGGGGGMALSSTEADLLHLTVVLNEANNVLLAISDATDGGGGLHSLNSLVRLRSSTFALNRVGLELGAVLERTCAGSVISLGNNAFAEVGECPVLDSSDVVASGVVDCCGGELGGAAVGAANARHQQPLLTIDPGADALDLTPADQCLDLDAEPLLADQRGSTRPRGDGCDAGAVEAQQGVSAFSRFRDGFEPGT